MLDGELRCGAIEWPRIADFTELPAKAAGPLPAPTPLPGTLASRAGGFHNLPGRCAPHFGHSIGARRCPIADTVNLLERRQVGGGLQTGGL